MTRVKLDTPAFADQSVDTRTIKDGTIIAQDVSGSLTNAKLANSSITVNGSSVSLGGSLSTTIFLEWQAVTVADGSTTLTAQSGKGYFLDTNTGVIEVFLPTSPDRGDTIALVDYSGTFGTNKLIINTGGVSIDSSITDGSTAGSEYQVTTNNAIVELVYVDSAKGWQVILNQAAGTTPDNALDTGGGYDTSTFIGATGGTVTTSGNFKIHTFTGDGCFVVSAVASAAANNEVSYLVVAGGGGSGSGGANCSAGGGGGAGGFRESKSGVDSYTASPLEGSSNITVTATTFPITVGGGGAAGSIPSADGTNGSNSVFSTITSAGGGHGGSYPASPGGNGGSGGGGGCNLSTGGSGNTPPVSPSQGSNGYVIPTAACFQNGAGGGGGGATAAGGASSGGPTFNGNGGAGGAGATTSITGSPVAYAGGGGGGGNNVAGAASPCGTGGVGAKGSSPGTNAAAGTANRGGGAGGGSHKSGQPPTGSPVSAKAGGKGIVVIRYKFQ